MQEDALKGGPLSILLIEDDQDHAELITRTLRDNRVANIIDHVFDGEAALDYLFKRGEYANRERKSLPSLVLLDLRIPKIDGFQVLKEVKSTEALAHVPVVILSSSCAERDIAKAYEYRANSYLLKPVDWSKFSEMMKDVGFYWLCWNVLPWKENDK